MTDDEAKDAILATLTSRPVTVDMVLDSATMVLAEDPARLGSFTKLLARNGAQFCAAINRQGVTDG